MKGLSQKNSFKAIRTTTIMTTTMQMTPTKDTASNSLNDTFIEFNCTWVDSKKEPHDIYWIAERQTLIIVIIE